MNRIKSYVLLLLVVVTMPLMTSCFKDSDADNSHNILNEEEVAEYLKKMKGTYTGKCYYSYLGRGNSGALVLKQDSTENIEWTLQENGEMKISKLPVSMISKALQAGSQFEFLSGAVSKLEDIVVDTKIVPYRTPDNWNYPFLIYPKENVVLNVKNDDRDYKVVLYYNNYINIQGLYFEMNGICKVHENQMLFTLPVGSVSVNEVQAGVSPSMFRYVGVKKAGDKEDKK